MTDYFALLGFQRTPWLDAETVQKRFLELSAAVHPDRAHNLGAQEIASANSKFSELNKAAATLRDSKERLHHLLALETGVATEATQNIDPALVELFSKVGQTNREVDQFLAERARAASPMLQAQLFGQGLDWTDRISELQQAVGAVKRSAESELQEIASRWPNAKPIDRLRALAHVFAMTSRWEAQLQERFAALAAV
jgi:DnaJ-domain-containing protein 1